jgi:hypothetical protein
LGARRLRPIDLLRETTSKRPAAAFEVGARRAPLITRNVRDFARVQGLRVEGIDGEAV